MTDTESTWGRRLGAAICEVCDWRYLYDSEIESVTCPHCYKAALSPSTENPADPFGNHKITPGLVAPFGVSNSILRQKLMEFTRSYWFAPVDLKTKNLLSRLRRVFVPAWLVASEVNASWQADVGYDYQVVSHRESYSSNRWITSEVRESKIRWEPRAGRLRRRYGNVRVPAMDEIEEIRDKLGKFDTKSAEDYQPGLINKALIRLPNRDKVDAWPDTHLTFRQRATEECRQAAEADHIRQFGWNADYNNQSWSLLLLPIFSTFYLDDNNEPVPVLLNGRTGQLYGHKRASMKRAQRYSVALAIMAAFLFLITVLLLVTEPSLGAISGLAMIVVGVSAVLPIAYSSRFNRRQASDLVFDRVD